MKTETKILGAILIITAVIFFVGIFFLGRQSSSTGSQQEAVQIDYTKGQKIGSDSARVKLVEFSDFECPACSAAEPFVKKLLVSYPDQLQFIYRHFPLPQHKFGRPAATLAETAGEQGKFWEMHDKLFETQSQWSGLSDPTVFFLGLARELNLDEEKVKQQLTEDSFKSKINEDIAEGQRLGVNATPTFFLNGRKLILKTFEDLNTDVAAELKK